MTSRYVIGPAYAVVRGGTVVVLPEKVTPELVEELWTVLGEQAGVVPVLEVLTGSFGASLASLPPFAIAVADGRRVQVASRGATSVTVARTDGRDHVSGEGVTTWAERTFSDVVDLAVQVGVTESAEDLLDERALPLDAGVVLVSSVGVRLTHDAAPAAAAPRTAPALEPWESEPEPEPAAPRPAAGTDDAEPVDLVGAVPVPEPDAAPAPAPASAPEATIAPESTMVPSLTVTDADVPRPADDAGDHDAGDAPGDEAPARVATGGPLAARGADDQAAADRSVGAPEAPVDETTGYGHLWGSTVHRAVEAAAVRPEPEDDEDEETPGPVPPPPAPPAADDRPAEATVAEPADPGTAAPEPAASDATPAVADAAPAGAEDDIDGSTVMSSAIADLRAVTSDPAPAGGQPAPVPVGAPAVEQGVGGAAPAVSPPGPSFAAAPLPGRPMILARSCTSGHPNPPQRDDCATCGQALVGEARQVPRPTLGTMAVSSGPRVTLDRPVVIGRRPRSPRSAGDDLPRLITVPSPEQDISRSHVEIRLEGWHVLVSDMSTTNGTTLLRSGQAPLRLHPGEPVLVVSQDVVDLGDGVTLTFEGIL